MSRFLKIFSFCIFCLSLFFFSSFCRLYNLERKLDPVNAEFLSKVRYIITSEERKIFLELPDSEKKKFREEFWKRRDPDPDTEENEFKMEYFDRIENASKLFVGEGRPGWLTDRGRIYVLFGPPTDRITYPREDAYSRSREIWYYGNFPVVFVDAGDGVYTLITYDLSSLRSINLMYMHELNLAQAEARKTFRKEKKLLDFNWSVNKTVMETGRVAGVIVIKIPYKAIWFQQKNDKLETTLDVHVDLKDSENTVIWEYEKAYGIAVKERELEEGKEENYIIEIPFILEENVDRLRLGKNQLRAVIKNRTGEEELEKVKEFEL